MAAVEPYVQMPTHPVFKNRKLSRRVERLEDALLACHFAAAPLAACWGGADPWVSIVRPGLRRISSYAGFAHLGSRGDDGLLGWAWEAGLGLRLGRIEVSVRVRVRVRARKGCLAAACGLQPLQIAHKSGAGTSSGAALAESAQHPPWGRRGRRGWR
eukprot:scaffold1394_cov57-Phaeocystis_antarctica.AAC.2